MPKIKVEFSTSCSLLSTWDIISKSENLFSSLGGTKVDTRADMLDIDQMVEMPRSGEQHLDLSVQIRELTGAWRGTDAKGFLYEGAWVLVKSESGAVITFTLEYPTVPQVLPGPVVDLDAIKRQFHNHLEIFAQALTEQIETQGEGKIIDVKVTVQ